MIEVHIALSMLANSSGMLLCCTVQHGSRTSLRAAGGVGDSKQQ
jgi:hypothetical protein